jgi:hypothetical protein
MVSTSNLAWDVVATFSDVPSAQVLVALFRSEGVPVDLVSDTYLLGEARRCEVRVPRALMHRARWLMAQAQVSDAELVFLATGKLGDADNADQ